MKAKMLKDLFLPKLGLSTNKKLIMIEGVSPKTAISN